MAIKEYEFHPYASVLPMLGTVELNELAADIQANGLRFDIVLLDGKILDGRNRYKACQIVGVEPRFKDFNGDGDPVDYIVSVNVKRRHLNTSQRSLVAAKITNLPRGDSSRFTKTSKTPINSQSAILRTGEKSSKTAKQAAEELNVSPRSVVSAKKVIHDAPKEAVEAIERGEKTVAAVARQTKAEKAKTEKHLDKTGYLIPESILDDWNHADAFRSTLNELHKIKLSVEKEVEKSELRFTEIGQDTVIELSNAWASLKSVIPYAVCPTCQGKNRSNCSACNKRGFVSEFGYKHWFAKEVIELRERSIKK